MGIFGFGKSGPTPNAGKFRFGDGSTHTPEEYGYLSVRVGSQTAVEQTNAVFGEGTLGSSLGLAAAVNRVRFAADIYTTMLEVGVYLWHAASMLKVNGEVMARIAKGVRHCLSDMRAPNGKPLEEDFKEFLLHQAYNFAIALQKDVELGSTLPLGVYRPEPLPSTALLVDMLLRSNSEDAAEVAAWREEMKSPAGVWVQRRTLN
ncbi:MAG: hypothetical protein RIQ60_3246 [Pseudomonadota bacterium]|jgi:hypothetical protein